MTRIDKDFSINLLRRVQVALRMANEQRFKKEIEDIDHEIKKMVDSPIREVFIDLILSHLIMSAKLNGCRGPREEL